MEPVTDTFFHRERKRNLGRLLWIFRRKFEQLAEEELRSRGYDQFKATDIRLLANIDLHHGSISNDLARKLSISRQAMSKMIRNLEDREVIYTRSHEKDKRAARVFLTANGMRFLNDIHAAVTKAKDYFAFKVGVKKIDLLLDILEEVDDKILEEEGGI